MPRPPALATTTTTREGRATRDATRTNAVDSAKSVDVDATTTRDGAEAIARDEGLRGHEEHLKYRYATYRARREAIESAEGSLDAFSKSYEKYGFNADEKSGEITYREWAPAAAHCALIGDFNGWNGEATAMTRDEYGTWEVKLPKGAIEHGSRVKVRILPGMARRSIACRRGCAGRRSRRE